MRRASQQCSPVSRGTMYKQMVPFTVFTNLNTPQTMGTITSGITQANMNLNELRWQTLSHNKKKETKPT